jgi:mannose-1-phosphate guanylyltransferase/mannose-6-phosphate isomerase
VSSTPVPRRVVPVILCGGAGSRLWPASRETYPKQLFAFGGGQSLFQDTVARVTGEGFGRPIIVTGNDYRFLVAEQLRALGQEGDVLLEPMRRDSCAAIAAAAAFAMARDPDSIVLVLAADHAIPDLDSFREHVTRGVAAAEAGRIVTFGIRPDHPATGYGYVRPGNAIAGLPGVNAIHAFVEKPDAATAKRYVAEGYLWNSGNFLFKARVFLDELARLAADIHGPATEAIASASRDLDFIRLDGEAFGQARATSVDYAVLEKTQLAAVVPSDFAWSDIGSWSAVWALADKDAEGNAASGDAVFHASSNCYAYSPLLLTTIVGLEDVVVVTTRDAVLVAAKDKSEEVKALVGRLAGMGRREAVEHLRNYRPWGDYEQIDKGTRYQVKRITVKPAGRLSLQSHCHRAEHWVVVSGTARVTVDEKTTLLTENQSVYIPLGAVHRLENPGKLPLELIEVQSGAYLGEDDIVRYEDVYNRS